ncbi:MULTISPECIES: hypothetical protein [unclassified Gordonia (in: high G+C Gram-positive bacteria)]|uniref:hypothetical protein n=1 Tax=unclassified Gordonia (in: high G+C Gram-positive bacteria) TaxID=2657482 RepID=UPI001F0E698F|nr:hypothetical protein [Gordonia sp. ABSL49_1]MCH5644826.1 hypothetical protein [Gordonia sp. ABSL49_1]
MWLAVAFSFLLAALVVVMIVQWQRGRNPRPLTPGQAANYVQGTFTITGVSDRPDEGDKNGERFATISGTIVGPETNPTEVYGTLVLGTTDRWPAIGDDISVLYKPHKAATSWRFGDLGQAGPPPGGSSFGD